MLSPRGQNGLKAMPKWVRGQNFGFGLGVDLVISLSYRALKSREISRENTCILGMLKTDNLLSGYPFIG